MKSLMLLSLFALVGCASLKEDVKPKSDKQIETIMQKYESKRV